MEQISKYLFIIGSILIALAIASCTSTNIKHDGNITIAATFYPLYEFTREIAGSSANVYSIVPINSDPHQYENTPKDLIRLNQADIFVTLGVQKGFAAYEQNLIDSASQNVKIIGAGNSIQQITPKGEFGDVSSDLNYNGLDPHIWVSPKNAILMAQNIRDGLVKADPSNTILYNNNAAILIFNLQKLDSDYAKGLSNCSTRIILAAHDAYSYLARDYGFKSYYVDGLSPEQEPTPMQIARLIDIAKQYNLKYIFYQSNVDPRISNTIAQQIGAKTLTLNPAESTDDPDQTYIQIMQENLKNLEIGMGCK